MSGTRAAVPAAVEPVNLGHKAVETLCKIVEIRMRGRRISFLDGHQKQGKVCQHGSCFIDGVFAVFVHFQ